MAKFGKVSEETQELVDKIVSELGLYNFMDIEVVNVPKSKKLIEIKRCPALGEHVAGKGDVVCVIVFESAFERLDENQREVLMRDAFNTIYFDSEKDKIVIGCPMINVSCSGLAKWGDSLLNAYEAGVYAIEQIAEEEKERKAQAKADKKNKNK